VTVGDGKKKGGLKVHMLTDIHADTPQFVKISEAKMHDKHFLQCLNPAPGSMIVFDDSRPASDPFDRSFELDVGRSRRPTCIRQTHERS
jgi:hypothetical protein